MFQQAASDGNLLIIFVYTGNFCAYYPLGGDSMQIKNWFRKLSIRKIHLKDWFSQAFRFQSGNLLDQGLRLLVIVVVVIVAGAWIGTSYFLPARAVLPQPVVTVPDNFDELVRKQLQSLLESEYYWVVERSTLPVVVQPPAVRETQIPDRKQVTPPPAEELPDPQTLRPGVDREPVQEALSITFDHILWPVKGEISINYGWYRHPVYQDWRFHSGLELSSVVNEGVRTVLPGRIEKIRPGGGGMELIVEHGSGWQSVYNGLHGLTVQVGEMIKQNHVIGMVNDHGSIFFALQYQGAPLDPTLYMR